MKSKLSKKHLQVFSAAIFIILILILLYLFLKKNKNIESHNDIPFFSVNSAWADTTLKYMSLEEKIGQLIYYKAYEVNNSNYDTLLTTVHQVSPGSIEFSTDSLNSFIRVQNNLQKLSKINVLTFLFTEKETFDFKDTYDFPNLLQIQAVTDDSATNRFYATWTTLNKMINITGTTVFSKIQQSDCEKCNTDYMNHLNAYIRNAQKNNIHVFVHENDFFSFDSMGYKSNCKLLKSGISGVILNNTNPEDKNPFGLVGNIRKKYRFNGLLIADSLLLDNDNIIKLFDLGFEIYKTEKPILLKKMIINLVNQNKIKTEQIDFAVRKILLAKTWSGLNIKNQIKNDDVKQKFDDKFNIKNVRTIFKNSVCLIKNEKKSIPFKTLSNKSVTLIDIGKNESKVLINTLNKYLYVNYKFFNVNDKQLIKNIKEYKKSGDVIIAFNSIIADSIIINALKLNNKALSNTLINFGNNNNLKYIDFFTGVIHLWNNSVTDFKNAGDAYFGGIPINGIVPVNIDSIVKNGYSLKLDKVRVADCLPEEAGLNSIILDKIDSIVDNAIRNGAFPGCQVVVLKNGFSVYDKAFGYQTYSKDKAVSKYDLYDLASVTKIAATTLAAMKMYDAGRLRLDDKLGKFFKDKSIDYSNIKPDTIFNVDTFYYNDIKDFSKILKYQDTIRLNDSMFMAYDTLLFSTTPKNNIFNVTIRELLLHKSGITPTLPILPYVLYKKNFYDSLQSIKERFDRDTSLQNSNFDIKLSLKKIFDEYFTRKYIKDSATVKIADNFYLQDRYFDTLWRDTKRLRVYSRKIYQYSDINMILLQLAIDSSLHANINNYLRTNFYLPMGLSTMCYNPLKYFKSQRIVPTENDKYWREQLLRGNVHDPSAAMLGGVSGNAGLFSNAYDLAILGQMWLNGGIYGGARYISEATVKKFTSRQEDSFRGLGFDKPTRKSIIGKGASPDSFGHTGFTGTCIWVDPYYKIVFVFLSNRVYPDPKNGRINQMHIRQKIHSVVYEAIIK